MCRTLGLTACSPLVFLCSTLALKSRWLSQEGLVAEGQGRARKKLGEGLLSISNV